MFFFYGKRPLSPELVMRNQEAFAGLIEHRVLTELYKQLIQRHREVKLLRKGGKKHRGKAKLEVTRCAVSKDVGLTWHEHRVVVEKGQLSLFHAQVKK